MKPLAFSLLGWVCALAGSAGLRAADLQTLIDRSPFSPPGMAVDASAPEPAGTLEFRGLVTDEAGTAYSLFDTSTNKGRWVRADDANGPLRVTGYDAANNVLDVEQNGRALRLSMKRATIQEGQAISAMASPAPSPTARPTTTTTLASRRTADAQHLKAVAEEVQNRRKLRQAALAKARASGQPVPAAISPGS